MLERVKGYDVVAVPKGTPLCSYIAPDSQDKVSSEKWTDTVVGALTEVCKTEHQAWLEGRDGRLYVVKGTCTFADKTKVPWKAIPKPPKPKS